jgi:hypothetical protein
MLTQFALSIKPTYSAFALTLPIALDQGILPLAVLVLLLQPFNINCPKIVYKRYLQEKVAWLVQHLDIDLKDYRTTLGLPVYLPKVLQKEVFAMPAPQVYDPRHRGIR